MPPIQLLLVDDHTMFREGLRRALEQAPDLQVVGEAATGSEAVRAVAELRPDVVLMDIDMPEMNGVEATRRILAQHPQTAVVMLSVIQAEEYVFQAVKVGACGYICKDQATSEAIRAVRAAARGEAIIDPAVAARLLHEFGRVWQPPPAGAPLLDQRETDILRRIARGASNREIGVALGLAEKTIKKAVTRIFTKLEISDRTQAAVYAAQHGLLDETTQ